MQRALPVTFSLILITSHNQKTDKMMMAVPSCKIQEGLSKGISQVFLCASLKKGVNKNWISLGGSV